MTPKKKLFTSYYGNPFLPKKQEGLLFAISCGVPDYFKDIPHLKIFAPEGLRHLHGKEFEVSYKEKLSMLEKSFIIQYLEKIPDGAFMLCYEKIGKPCHRHLLSEYLRTLGIDIVEYQLSKDQVTLQGRLKANLRGSSHENVGANPAPAASLFD